MSCRSHQTFIAATTKRTQNGFSTHTTKKAATAVFKSPQHIHPYRRLDADASARAMNHHDSNRSQRGDMPWPGGGQPEPRYPGLASHHDLGRARQRTDAHNK